MNKRHYLFLLLLRHKPSTNWPIYWLHTITTTTPV